MCAHFILVTFTPMVPLTKGSPCLPPPLSQLSFVLLVLLFPLYEDDFLHSLRSVTISIKAFQMAEVGSREFG